jgi:hypothetical protein
MYIETGQIINFYYFYKLSFQVTSKQNLYYIL